MKRYKLNISDNSSFNTITGLTNTSFNPTTYVENRMATEEQISQLYNRIIEQENRRDQCCRDIIIWEAHTQIVRMNTNSIHSYGYLNGGGVVISSFDENVNVGTMRRGKKYTVTFPVKWDNSLYVKRNAATASISNCFHFNDVDTNSKHWTRVKYRFIEDNSPINVGQCQNTNNTVSGFWTSIGIFLSNPPFNNLEGYRINDGDSWGYFTYDMKDDGTVTITDNRGNINFNIIRYYTQWILKRCADGSIISDPE